MRKLLYPPVWALILFPVLSFVALTVVFACQRTENALAYFVYSMSTHSLS